MSEVASVSISHSETIDKNIIMLDKDELLQKLYKLNEDNLLLTEQLKQYHISLKH